MLRVSVQGEDWRWAEDGERWGLSDGGGNTLGRGKVSMIKG